MLARDVLALCVAALACFVAARAREGVAFAPAARFDDGARAFRGARDDGGRRAVAGVAPAMSRTHAYVAGARAREGVRREARDDAGPRWKRMGKQYGTSVGRHGAARATASLARLDDDDDDDDDDDAYGAIVIERGIVGEGRSRRGIVVAATRDARVVAFDDALDELWRADAAPTATRGRWRATEASIVVTNEGAELGDDGLVVVGVRREGRARRGLSDEALRRMTMGTRRGRAPGFGSSDGADAVEREILEDATSGEFEYHAFDARTGARRWTETSDEDAHRRSARARPSLRNLDDDEIDGAAERACRDFRESIVRDGLPHQWRHAVDTKMRLAHFRRHKSRANAMARDKARAGKRKRGAAAVKSVPSNAVTRVFGRAVDALKGEAKRRLDDDDAHPPHASTHARRVRKREPPNVVVSHHAEGVDVLHLYSGVKVCEMKLKSSGLHVDLDGDGVVDHVEAHGRNSRAAEDIPHCWATVTSGVPEEGRTLSASICRGGSGLAGHRAAQIAGRDIRAVEVVSPISLRRLPETSSELAKPLDRMGRDAIFLNNRGEMTCYNARDGEQKRWQIRTTADWTPNDDVVKPSLTSFPIRVDGYLDLAIATGASSMVIVNSKGYRATAPIELPAPPAAPLVARDVDGDGFTDLVLHTTAGVYVWIQTPRAGNLPFTFLVGALAASASLALAFRLRDADADVRDVRARASPPPSSSSSDDDVDDVRE